MTKAFETKSLARRTLLAALGREFELIIEKIRARKSTNL
jgi:hypothetical protein